MKGKLPEDKKHVPQVDRGATRKEHHDHAQVQEVQEEGPHQVETGKLSPWPFFTTFMLQFPVSHLGHSFSFVTDLACSY